MSDVGQNIQKMYYVGYIFAHWEGRLGGKIN